MPTNYAHYRFGSQILPNLPADVRRPIQRFRPLFDMGLHGPDIFFFYNFYMDNPLIRLGKKMHQMTGRDFFGAVCRRLRLEPTEGGQAYLYGLLAHYCLDSVCHPFVLEQTADGKFGHTELETEFDRYLLALDGNPTPETVDLSRHMKLTKGECVTVAGFYPGVTPGNVLQSVQTMAYVTRMLAIPKGSSRRLMQKAAGAVVSKFAPFIMPSSPNVSCAHLDQELNRLYEEALALYPILLEQLTAHITYNAPLGETFEKPFG